VINIFPASAVDPISLASSAVCPLIIVDPQGDIASLALEGNPEEKS